jgi:hypothetical protein
LTPAQISQLQGLGVSSITATDASIVIDAAQVVALEAGSIKLAAPSGDTVTLSDTAADFATLTAAQIVDLPAIGIDENVACFCLGTLILTDKCEVRVEQLAIGDIVLTNDGRYAPVTWLGVKAVSTRFANPLRVLPIRIKAGALAENIPSRDLLLSPDHAVMIDDVLIQAGALVNGASIVREANVPEIFTYYHVETDDHSLIFAENTPAETFVDNVDRLHFDNWAEHEVLYPNGKPIDELPYPRAKAHRQVPMHVRALLAKRAQAIGHATVAA